MDILFRKNGIADIPKQFTTFTKNINAAEAKSKPSPKNNDILFMVMVLFVLFFT